MVIKLATRTAAKLWEGIRQFNKDMPPFEAIELDKPSLASKSLTVTVTADTTTLAFNADFIDQGADLIIETMDEIAPYILIVRTTFKRLKKSWGAFKEKWEGEATSATPVPTPVKGSAAGALTAEKLMEMARQQGINIPED